MSYILSVYEHIFNPQEWTHIFRSAKLIFFFKNIAKINKISVERTLCNTIRRYAVWCCSAECYFTYPVLEFLSEKENDIILWWKLLIYGYGWCRVHLSFFLLTKASYFHLMNELVYALMTEYTIIFKASIIILNEKRNYSPK